MKKRKRVRFSEGVVGGRLVGREVGGGQDDIDLDDGEDDEEEEVGVDRGGEEEEDGDVRYNEDGEMIEPFNLKSERANDGYFDAQGSFVFRKGGGEPDAWLASMDEAEAEAAIGSVRRKKPTEEEEEEVPLQESLRNAVYLLRGDETIAACLRRLGKDLPRSRKDFDDLTEISDRLIRHGRYGLDEKRSALLQQIDEETLWEYRGMNEGAVHGPFPTSQILEWRNAGYFTGDTAVSMRKHREKDAAALSTNEQEFLDDFGDDDDDDNEQLPGEPWRSSDDIDFRSPANQPMRKRSSSGGQSAPSPPASDEDDDD